jgi:hypothetical protein
MREEEVRTRPANFKTKPKESGIIRHYSIGISNNTYSYWEGIIYKTVDTTYVLIRNLYATKNSLTHNNIKLPRCTLYYLNKLHAASAFTALQIPPFTSIYCIYSFCPPLTIGSTQLHFFTPITSPRS